MKANFLLLVPTVELNGDDTIHKISWVYETGDGAPIDDPRDIVSDRFYVQIAKGGFRATQEWMPLDARGHVLEVQDIPWAEVTLIALCYKDAYGNNYHNAFSK